MIPFLSRDISICTVDPVWSFAANALKMVAFIVVPFSVVANPVLACKINDAVRVFILIIVYSPYPLKV